MPDGSAPGAEEKILWRHDIRKGFLRRRTAGTLAVTSRRIIGIDAQIPLQELDDVLVRNRRETATHSGISRRYPSYGGSSGWEDVRLQTETRVTGDVVFMRGGEPAIVFHGFDNPDYLVKITRAARDSLVQTLSGKGGHDDAIVCSRCDISNPPDSRFCNSCGRSLAPACPKCGREGPAGASFCGHCGAAMP